MRLGVKAACAMAAVVLAGAGTARGDVPQDAPAKALMSDLLVHEAQLRARETVLSPELRAKQSHILLTAAARLTPESAEVQRLLAEAAAAAGDTAAAREALKQVMRADKGNLVAQVTFLDLVAQGRPVEEQIKVYRAALEQQTLNPQVRSEMATRLARLLAERGETAESRKMARQAIALNDLNVGAWQLVAADLAAQRAPAGERMQALVGLLTASAYQPEALLAAGRLLAGANQHALAAEYLLAAAEQYAISGVRPLDLLPELAMELASAGRTNEAKALLNDLLNVEGGAAEIPLTAALVAGGRGATGEGIDKFITELRKRLDAEMAARKGDPAAVASAVWADLLAAPVMSAETGKRLAELQESLGADSDLYKRLAGWSAYREGKLADAKALLTPLAEKDIWARIGLAQIALAQGEAAAGAAHLQEAWREHPTGAAALEVVTLARKANVTLPDTRLGAEVKAAAEKLPAGWLTAHRKPRDYVLITTDMPKRRYDVGEPISMRVRMVNTADRPLSVGPGGMVPTSLAVMGSLRGLDNRPLGLIAVDNPQRVYRLERREAAEYTMRLDAGMLRQIMYARPAQLLSVTTALLAAPRTAGANVALGLGGQQVIGPAFDREGMSVNNPAVLLQIAQKIDGMDKAQQMLLGQVLVAILPSISEMEAAADANATATAPVEGAATTEAATQDAATQPAATAPAMLPLSTQAAEARESLRNLREAVLNAAVGRLRQGSPLVQAWLVSYAPGVMPEEVTAALADLARSDDPLVRMMVYRRWSGMGMMEDRAAAEAKLRAAAESEKDPLARQWATALAQQLAAPAATEPATAPATVPATREGGTGQ